MSVHQIDEYYIHMEIPENKLDIITHTLIDDCMDYEMYEGDLTIDGFSSEHEAEAYENKLSEQLN